MTLAFYTAHTTDGRTRIRWAGDAGEKAIVGEVAENIALIEDVDQALPRITTGSIIIEHDQVQWPALRQQLIDRLSLEFTAPSPPQARPGLATLNQGLDKVDNTLKGINTDLGSVTALLLIILSITQALRGQVMGNSISFLWYALSIATMSRDSASTQPDTTADVSD